MTLTQLSAHWQELRTQARDRGNAFSPGIAEKLFAARVENREAAFRAWLMRQGPIDTMLGEANSEARYWITEHDKLAAEARKQNIPAKNIASARLLPTGADIASAATKGLWIVGGVAAAGALLLILTRGAR